MPSLSVDLADQLKKPPITEKIKDHYLQYISNNNQVLHCSKQLLDTMKNTKTAVNNKYTKTIKLLNEAAKKKEFQSGQVMEQSIRDMQFSYGYQIRGVGDGPVGVEAIMIAADKARSYKTPSNLVEKKKIVRSNYSSFSRLSNKAQEPTSPIKMFIKMIDFRQDDIRNIKAFLENAKNESNMENRKALYDFEPENSDSCESGDE